MTTTQVERRLQSAGPYMIVRGDGHKLLFQMSESDRIFGIIADSTSGDPGEACG